MLTMQHGELIATRGARAITIQTVGYTERETAARIYYGHTIAACLAGGSLTGPDARRLGLQRGLLCEAA